MLGLRVAKDMRIDKIVAFGYSELIIHKIKNMYQTKHQILRHYINEVWDLIENIFLSFNITFVQRSLNQQVDSLALTASNFNTPMFSNLRYEIEVRHGPSIPYSIKYW
jgi:hypothetical protein